MDIPVEQYLGVIAFFVMVLNVLKRFVPDLIGGNSEQWAATIQVLVAAVLALVGAFAPEALAFLPWLNEVANWLAEMGWGLLGILAAAPWVSNLMHDAISKVPLVNRAVGYRLTA